MRIAVRILGIGAALATVIVVAIAIAIAAVDVGVFIGPLKQRVKETTGRELTIGHIDLQRSLVPTLVLSDVGLANAPWGTAPRLAAAKRIEVQMALLPLLQRRYEVKRVVLDQPAVALETDGSGRGNWEIDRRPDVRPAADAASPDSLVAAFGIGEITIDNGTVTWRDHADAKTTTIAIERLAAHARDPQSALAIDFRGRFDEVALTIAGTVASEDAIRLGRGPYPLDLSGEIAGRKAALKTVLGFIDGGYRFDALTLAYGQNAVTGELTVLSGRARPRVAFKLAARALALADVPLPLATAGPVRTGSARAPGAGPASMLFDTEPVDFAFLRSVDADGELSIDQLTLANGRRVDQVHARLALHDAHLDVPSLQAAVFGGSALVRLQINAAQPQQPALKLNVDAKELDLAALLAAAGVRREVHGGKTHVTLDIATRGVSPRQWASAATGTLTAIAGPATLANTTSDAGSPLIRLAEVVNPFYAIDATTELQCAVVRLPFVNGVAHVDRSIAIETKKLGASATGTVDLRSETLDLTVKPRVKEGVNVKLLQLASLVHVKGPFADPTVGVSGLASAQTVARLGAAYATAGLSVLGESLLSGVTNSGAECAIAGGRNPERR